MREKHCAPQPCHTDNLCLKSTCAGSLVPFKNRLEKLRCLIAEMQLALLLARHAPDDFSARTLARHIVGRTENFIEHARRLRTALRQAGFNTRSYNNKKETYAKDFDDYFRTARHKLSAHVQDIDFGKRIELWNDVEVSKISYFVDGAKEIHDSLAALNIPGFIAYTEPPELTDPALLVLLQDFMGSAELRLRAEIGTDPLAMTRPHAVAILVTGDVQARASQLALIRRWITAQLDWLKRFETYPGIARILKERLVTDIVSFCDGLVTRAVAPGAPQEMEGLNTLLANINQDVSAIDRFVQVSSFESSLQAARRVRDHVGAHLEIDDAITLTDILREIDTFDLKTALDFFDRVARVFMKVCHDVHFLRMYAVDGQQLYGIMPNSFRVTPFDDRNPRAAEVRHLPVPQYDNDSIYRDNLGKWLRGDEIERHNARQFFWNAFLYSSSVEEITERDEWGAGPQRMQQRLRTVHRFFIDEARSGRLNIALPQVFELLLTCRSGDPYALCELVLRCLDANAPERTMPICYVLGELTRWPHGSVREFLTRLARDDTNWSLQFAAILALFKAFVRSLGFARLNEKSMGRSPALELSYANDIEPYLAGLPAIRKLLCVVAFASQFCSQQLSYCAKPLAAEYEALRAAVERLCKEVIPSELLPNDQVELLQKLIETHDYVGVCLWCAYRFDSAQLGPLADDLLTAACGGWVIAAPHHQATVHLIGCRLRKSDVAEALRLADHLAARHPDNVDFQILAARILAETPDSAERLTHKIAGIRSGYKLTQAQEQTLAGLERKLAEKSGEDIS